MSFISAFAWHHIEIAFYVLLFLFLFYVPPRPVRQFLSLDFIERHFGDSVGFYILHLGVVLYIISAAWPAMKELSAVGQSFVLAGTVALKLKSPNGNGGGSVPPAADAADKPKA